jgi:hypothetical protein
LAEKLQDKLRQLVDLWWAEAGKYNVLPLVDGIPDLLPALKKERTSYTCYPGTARIPDGSTPQTINQSFTITAEVEIPAANGGAEGPICAIGGVNSGWSLHQRPSLGILLP